MILKWEAWSSILHEGTFYKFDANWEVNIPGEEVLEEVELEEVVENTEEEEVLEEVVVKKKVKSKK